MSCNLGSSKITIVDWNFGLNKTTIASNNVGLGHHHNNLNFFIHEGIQFGPKSLFDLDNLRLMLRVARYNPTHKIQLHHSILHLGHHPPWLMISSGINPGGATQPSPFNRKAAQSRLNGPSALQDLCLFLTHHEP